MFRLRFAELINEHKTNNQEPSFSHIFFFISSLFRCMPLKRQKIHIYFRFIFFSGILKRLYFAWAFSHVSCSLLGILFFFMISLLVSEGFLFGHNMIVTVFFSRGTFRVPKNLIFVPENSMNGNKWKLSGQK